VIYSFLKDGVVVNVVLADEAFCQEQVAAGVIDQYVEGALVMVPPPASTVISRVGFLKRMTAQERIAIRDAARVNPQIDDLQRMLDAADPVHLDDPLVIYGINLLESVGLLGPGRAATILTP
jgi:hypothetical protein